MTGNRVLPFVLPAPAARTSGADDRDWRELFELNLSKLFLLALVLTGDVGVSEAALLASLDLLEAELPARGAAGFDEVRRAVARSSVVLARAQLARTATPPPLPAELQSLLRLDPEVRCCFVLRILAKYSNRDCALLLDLPAEGVTALVDTALMSLSLRPEDHSAGGREK